MYQIGYRDGNEWVSDTSEYQVNIFDAECVAGDFADLYGKTDADRAEYVRGFLAAYNASIKTKVRRD